MDFRQIIEEAGGIRAAERLLRSKGMNISARTIARRLQQEVRNDFEVEELQELDVEDLIEERIAKFRQKKAIHDAHKEVTIRVKASGPIGIGFMGDPHIDDDGTNIEKLLDHTDLFDGSQDGLFAIMLGDVWNNWQGRMARLWADQSTSAEEARLLVEYFLKKVYWLCVLFGNHDAWGGKTDILDYILRQQSAVSSPWRQRLKLVFPNGRELRIHASHKPKGSSQWTPAFGVLKKAQLDGAGDIYVAGHIHTSAYTHGWHEGNRKMWHAVQVASYKEMDDYADEIGAEPHDMYCCPVAIIDPEASDPVNFIRWEWDPSEGAERLKWMRSR